MPNLGRAGAERAVQGAAGAVRGAAGGRRRRGRNQGGGQGGLQATSAAARQPAGNMRMHAPCLLVRQLTHAHHALLIEPTTTAPTLPPRNGAHPPDHSIHHSHHSDKAPATHAHAARMQYAHTTQYHPPTLPHRAPPRSHCPSGAARRRPSSCSLSTRQIRPRQPASRRRASTCPRCWRWRTS